MAIRLLTMGPDDQTLATPAGQIAIAAIVCRVTDHPIADLLDGRLVDPSHDRSLCELIADLSVVTGLSERRITEECERASIW